MSKVICDICGTSYPETATQCPICGCVRSGNVSTIDSGSERADTSGTQTYTYVKGGRFSKANVKKRNLGIVPEVKHANGPRGEESDDKSEKGLVAAICTLLLAIVAVVIYIVINFFSINEPVHQEPDDTINSDVIQDVQQSDQTPVDTSIPCVDLTIHEADVKLTEPGSKHILNVIMTPVDTTDTLTFSSKNPDVATVTVSGEITAVAEGVTTIYIQCGDVTKECQVTCLFQTVIEPTVQYNAPFRTNKERQGNDVRISVGEAFQLKLLDADGQTIPVQWIVEDPAVCSVEGNSVTGLMQGKTKITVTYQGEVHSCIVRVRG